MGVPEAVDAPSKHYRRAGFSSFQEDRAGLALVEPYDLVESFLWANDYPHHEGIWPQSAEAIERQIDTSPTGHEQRSWA